MILAKLTLLSLVVLPQAAGQDPAQEPPPAEGLEVVADKDRLDLVYLANEGFMLRSGNFFILIDAFFREPNQGLDTIPKPIMRRLQTGKPPFNGFSLALTSHSHSDHFQPRIAERFLRSNPMSALMSSPQVVKRLVEASEDFKSIQTQARAVTCKPGVPKLLDRGEALMGIEFMLLPHNGGEEDADVTNYGHIVRMGGFKVLHVGDAAPKPRAFKAFDLPSKDIDIAIVPYWFLMTKEGVRIIDEMIQAEHVIACHMPTAEKERFAELMKENTHVITFRNPGDGLKFDRSGNPPTAFGQDEFLALPEKASSEDE